MLETMIATAQEEVGAYLGVRLESAEIEDRFGAWPVGGRLVASAPFSGDPTIRIMAPSSDDEVVLDVANYLVDRTTDVPVIVPREPVELNEHVAAPVGLKYMMGSTDLPEMKERLTNAILTRVGILFESRGTLPPKGWERAVASTLPRVF